LRPRGAQKSRHPLAMHPANLHIHHVSYAAFAADSYAKAL
jgi:hypothetical protein